MFYPFYRYLTTEELIAIVEEEDFWNADIFLVPPEDGEESAEDSGDEDNCVDINRLSGRQLRAQAPLTHEGRIFRLGEDSSNKEIESE